MDVQSIGRFLLIGGIVLALVGAALLLFGRIPFVNSLGKLPGDIRIGGERFSFFFPIATSILISIILTVIVNIALRIINRQ